MTDEAPDCQTIRHLDVSSNELVRVAMAQRDGDAGSPAPVLELLQGLEGATREAGIRLDVLPHVFSRILDPPHRSGRGPSSDSILARACLADVWSRALESRPDAIGLSLSHSRGLCAAAVRLGKKGGSALIGVDVEPTSRRLPVRVQNRIAHPSDAWGGLLPIARWAVKEAMFKGAHAAIPAFRQLEAKLLPQSASRWTGIGLSAEGSFDLSVLIIDGAVLALAMPEFRPP